ncbi:hypothetical protein AC244_00685 [Ensifer adhaerens]|uniref:Uncharacterized protein n=1 Tax=Ensifer adhaerens TaxID=106592 RepID=A0A0L8C5C5_ENSAD|nr:hypothetical protein AC244_00685 [Ensifer adhaerens]
MKCLFLIHQQAGRVPQPCCVIGELRDRGNRVGGQAVLEAVKLASEGMFLRQAVPQLQSELAERVLRRRPCSVGEGKAVQPVGAGALKAAILIHVYS